MARKRDTIEPQPGPRRFIRRNSNGEWTTDPADDGRSATQDRKQPARPKSKPDPAEKAGR
jgi:hypothetical protein